MSNFIRALVALGLPGDTPPEWAWYRTIGHNLMIIGQKEVIERFGYMSYVQSVAVREEIFYRLAYQKELNKVLNKVL